MVDVMAGRYVAWIGTGRVWTITGRGLQFLGGGADVATLSAITPSQAWGDTASQFWCEISTGVSAADIRDPKSRFRWLNIICAHTMSGAVRSSLDEDRNLRALNAALPNLRGGRAAERKRDAHSPLTVHVAISVNDPDQRLLRF